GRLTLSNSNAEELLGVASAGEAAPGDDAASADDRAVPSIDVPEQITAMVDNAPAEGALRRRITIGERILLATAVRVQHGGVAVGDRKSTRLNSSHVSISYAVFCLKKKKTTQSDTTR